MTKVVITDLVPELDGDGLIVRGTVDGTEVEAHAWKSHLYADHDGHDRVRSGTRWYSQELCSVCEGVTGGDNQCDHCDGTGYEPTPPVLLAPKERLQSDKERREYLAGLLLEAAGRPSRGGLSHLLGEV